jgi:hypothetical protein
MLMLSYQHSSSSPSTIGTKSMSTLCTMDTEYADASASTPAVVLEHHGRRACLPALHLDTQSLLMSQLSTPAVVRSTMGTKSMSTLCCTMDTQSMLCLSYQHSGSPGALWARRACLPCAALWTTQSMLMPLSYQQSCPEHRATKSMSTLRCTMDTEYADASATSTPAVVPEHYGQRRACLPCAAPTHRAC